MVKSPLRYPGAKSRAIDQILPLIPDFVEYREPLLGGGSVYLSVKDKYGIEKKYWINDLNSELYNFWKQIQQNVDEMIKQLLKWKNDFNDKDGKQLQQFLKTNSYKFNDIELGSAYLALNRMSFSGLPRGFSQHNFETTYTEEKIKSLKLLSEILQGTKITNLDYSKLVEAPGDNVFIFCCLPGTKIRMKEERLLNIENVKIGDTTFLGGNVLNTIERDYFGNIYEFEIMGIYDNLSVTEEHPLAIIRQEQVYEYKSKKMSKFKHQDILNLLNIGFVNAKDIRIGDFLLVPCYHESIINIETIKIGNVNIPCDYDCGWIWGFWLAEHINRYYTKGIIKPNRINDIERGGQSTLGFFDENFEIQKDISEEMKNIKELKEKSKYDSCYGVTFSCGENDILYGFLKRLDKWFGQNLGIKGHIQYLSQNHEYQITYYHKEFAKFMYDKFGEYAGNKYVDIDLLNYRLDFQRGLLQGWLDGDGGNFIDRRNRTKITGTTTSKQLALDMYSISLRLGLKPMMKLRGDSWDVYFSSDDAIILSSNNSSKFTIPKKEYGDRSKRRIIKKGNMKFILSPITDIYVNKYNGKVYNLMTEKRVYIANYILNHNCDPPYYNVKWPELYGKSGKGSFHMWFDHYKFAEVMKKCKHKWLITYDDSQTIRKLFDWANVIPWELTYTSRKVKTGQELFISNYLEEIEEKEEIAKQIQANILNAWG